MRIVEIITPDGQEFDLDGIRNDIDGTQSHDEIIAIVEKHFSIAKVTVVRTAQLKEGELSISAHYDPDLDEEGDTAVFITLLFSREGPASYTWSDNNKKYFSATHKVCSPNILHSCSR